MAIERVGFTDPAKIIIPENKESTNQKQEVPAVDDSELNSVAPKSHKIRNWSIGLGAAATLIALGVAVKKGHIVRSAKSVAGNADVLKYKFHPDIKLDYDMPKLDKSLYKIDIPDISKYTDIRDVSAVNEMNKLEDRFIKQLKLDNGETKVLMLDKDKKYSGYVVLDKADNVKYIGTVGEDGTLTSLGTEDNSFCVTFGQAKLTKVIKNILKSHDDGILYYDSYGTLKYFVKDIEGIETSVSFSKNGAGELYPQFLIYKDSSVNKEIKDFSFAEDGKTLLLAHRYDENGKVVDCINNVE